MVLKETIPIRSQSDTDLENFDRKMVLHDMFNFMQNVSKSIYALYLGLFNI